VSAATMWALIGGSAAITALLKGAGPFALGGRELPSWFSAIVALMAPALFAALVVTQVLADGRDLGVGADTAGVALAGVVAWRGASVITVVSVAALTAATLRAVT
jgi:branched-subunit amino acid transport protein